MAFGCVIFNYGAVRRLAQARIGKWLPARGEEEQGVASRVERSAVVPHSARAMYRLVADVEAYPEFLPWCVSARVHPLGSREVQATLEVAKGPLRMRFTTRNVLYEGRRVEMHLVEGPFSHLEGVWTFTDLDGERCRVSLHMVFEFSQTLVRAAVSPVFEDIAGTMVQAFQRRAAAVYDDA